MAGEDKVEEARELLSRLSDWPNSIPDIKHALFADAVERERDSPFFGCATPIADLYGRAPELLSALCDEVERQVRIADSLERHIESQDRQISDLQRSNIEAHEAIRAAIEYVNSVGRDLPHALGCEQQLVEQLETVITPKGTSNGE